MTTVTTVTQVIQRTNVVAPAAPPPFFFPNVTGAVAGAAVLGYQIITDSPAYASGSVAALAAEIQLSDGTWKQFASAGGYTLGSYVSDDTGQPTTVNSMAVTFSAGLRAHTHVRLRIDSIPAGTLASLTVNQLS